MVEAEFKLVLKDGEDQARPRECSALREARGELS